MKGPPPPPGAGKSLGARPTVGKKTVKYMAKSKMKQLQWDKMNDAQLMKTVWGQKLQEREQIEDMFGLALGESGLFDNMENLFMAKAAADLSAKSE